MTTLSRTQWTLCLLAAALLAQGCNLKGRGKCEPDAINEYKDAALVPPTGPIADALDADCDRVDWRYVSHFEDSGASITIRMGDPFAGHELTGVVAVYDQDAQLIVEAQVRPNESRYVFDLQVEARKRYYVKLEAKEGRAAYQIEVFYSKKDPCASCPPCTTCIDNQCVKVPCCGKCPADRCDLATDTCIPEGPCGGPCPDGQICDEDEERCVECKVNRDCPKGTVCRRGECVTRSGGKAPPKPECVASGDCPSGRECRGGRCVKADEPVVVEPVAAKKVTGIITQVQEGASGVIIRIALSPGHGIQKGAGGRAGSHRFKVTAVGGARVDAVIEGIKKEADLGKTRSVVFD
jgi:Cys-rich repeat protein